MVKSLSCAGILFAAALALSGCTVPVNKPIIVYERNAIAVPKVKTVDTKGLYVLFPGNGVTPLEAVYLHPGDEYGFRPNEGRVAGYYKQDGQSKFVSLNDVLASDYSWRFQGDKQP